MVRKISEKVSDEVLHRDLEKYRQRALELGATDAKIISTDVILVDERVRAKCIYPKCTHFGTNANCPPYAMDLDMFRRVVKNFQYAIFTRLEVPSAEIAGPERIPVRSQIKNHEIISKVEAEAFYDGYYLALGLADGPCKLAFCPDIECSALVPGQACRHALRARSSLEAVGVNGFTMAVKVGWKVYPIGRSTLPSDVPYGTKLGLVLVY